MEITDATGSRSKEPFLNLLGKFLMKVVPISVLAGILLGLSLKYKLITRFICPISDLLLGMIGFGGLKSKTLIVIAILWYSMVTYVGMTVFRGMHSLSLGRLPELRNPRDYKQVSSDSVKRLHSAQLNSQEALILLVAAVLVSWNAGVADEKILELVTYFLVMRKVYFWAYALDCPEVRSTTYLSGCYACLYLMYLAVLKGC